MFILFIRHLGVAYHSYAKELCLVFHSWSFSLEPFCTCCWFHGCLDLCFWIHLHVCRQHRVYAGLLHRQDLAVRFWAQHLCVPPLPLSCSECVSPTLSCSVSFSLVAGMFDGWFTWLLRTQTCPWCDLSVVGVVVLLTKIPIGTNPVPLIGLGPVSNTSRQLLVKSSYWTYGKQWHHEITLHSPCVLQNECRLTGSGWLKSMLDYFNRTSKVLLSHKLTVNLPIRTALALVSNTAVFQVNVAPCDSNIRMN